MVYGPKLWLIKAIGGSPGHDMASGFVIRAGNPNAARLIACNNAGDEGGNFWMDTKKSLCRMIRRDGRSKLILRDFNAG